MTAPAKQQVLTAGLACGCFVAALSLAWWGPMAPRTFSTSFCMFLAGGMCLGEFFRCIPRLAARTILGIMLLVSAILLGSMLLPGT